MKQGDELAVSIEGITVGAAIVEEVYDGKVTIFIPATRVVMGIRTSLTADTGAPEVDRTLGTQVDHGDTTSEAQDEVDAPVQDTIPLSQQRLDDDV